jgi:hypothetical protein
MSEKLNQSFKRIKNAYFPTSVRFKLDIKITRYYDE